MNESISETIRQAVHEAQKAGDADNSHLAHVEADGSIPEKHLRRITETPSGKRYAILTLGEAVAWLASMGIRLVVDQSGRELRTYEVEVEVRGFQTVTIEAYDEDEALEAAVEMAQDDWCDLDYDAHIVSGELGAKRGAA